MSAHLKTDLLILSTFLGKYAEAIQFGLLKKFM